MNNQFSYRILNYTHSQFLGEILNVGILFYFNDTERYVFRYPSNFKRIRELYSDFAESQLKASLRAINEKVFRANDAIKTLFFEGNEENVIHEVLKNDATALSFSEFRIGESYSDNWEKIVSDFYDLYFSNYKSEYKKEKHNEEYLLRTFKQKLILGKSGIENLLRKDVQIKSTKTTVKFEYQWQNGVTNLVKPISFDLEDEHSINNKAILNYAQLNFISNEIKEKNYNVDILIAKPSIEIGNNKNLLNAYYKAIEILSETEIKKSIIEEKEVDRYVQRVISTIHGSEGNE